MKMFNYIFDLVNVNGLTRDLIIRISYFAFLMGILIGAIVAGYFDNI